MGGAVAVKAAATARSSPTENSQLLAPEQAPVQTDNSEPASGTAVATTWAPSTIATVQ
jgi:hypothetical protein